MITAPSRHVSYQLAVLAAAMFAAASFATELSAQPDRNAVKAHRVRESAEVLDDDFTHVRWRDEYFHELDTLVATHAAYVADHASVSTADLTDRLLSSMVERVPMLYLRAYLMRPIPRASADAKARLEQVLQRIDQLDDINFDSEAAGTLVEDAVRQRRVSTLMVCLGLLNDVKRQIEAAGALANHREPRVIRFLIQIAQRGTPGGHDNARLVQIALRNSVIKSLSALTGRDLALIVTPRQVSLPGETGEQFSARMVADVRESEKRGLEAALAGARWLQKHNLRRTATPQAQAGDKSTPPRPLAAEADVVGDAGNDYEMGPLYSRVIEQHVYRFDDAAARDAESDAQQDDRLLSNIIEDVPAAEVRRHLAKSLSSRDTLARTQRYRRLLDRLKELDSMAGAQARVRIAASARERHLPMLLLYFAAIRDRTCRAEAAEALANFNEPRVVRCLSNALLDLTPGARREGAGMEPSQLLLLNTIIKSLATLTGADLALIGQPPRRGSDDEGEQEFAVLLRTARREATDRCLNAVEHCERWLDERGRPESESSYTSRERK